MKISEVFLLLCLFLFFPDAGVRPLCAQDLRDEMFRLKTAIEGRQFELEMKLKDQQEALENLEKRCQKLQDALKDTQVEMRDLKTDARILYEKTDDSGKQTDDLKHGLNDLLDGLYKTDQRLLTAETDIAELKIRELKSGRARIPPRPASSTAAANQPKAPVNKPNPEGKKGAH